MVTPIVSTHTSITGTAGAAVGELKLLFFVDRIGKTRAETRAAVNYNTSWVRRGRVSNDGKFPQ
jgi:hypothetical protein